ncbi:MAG: hypothetical protein FD126_2553 [Elusimicrobia bacterium]|nr:MAG: hypothetical protein FD126_2553 [Elusimicrobiota bacterium]
MLAQYWEGVETKTAVMVVMLCLGAAGVVGGLLSVFKPQSARETEAVTAPTAGNFPARKASGADMSAEKMSAPEEWGGATTRRSGKGPDGSLNFIRNAEGMSTGSEGGPGQPSDEAAAAAARGDAKGMMEGLQKDGEKGMSKKASRALMQKVVDKVHQAQPRWYNEFLANKELKGIADAYDKGMDFGAFLSQLAKSKPFRAMLKKRSNTSQLRGLTKNLLSDKEVGPKLEELFFAHAKDPDVLDSVREFGPGAGLPSELLSFAGVGAKKTAAKPKLGAGKMKLQPRAFGSKGGFSKGGNADADAGGGGEGEMPEGVDPAMLQQYQKYMKK